MPEKHTIIYAEDDQDDVFMVTKAFEVHDNIQVVHADNGADALQVLNTMLQDNRKPCLVILDINMPVMSGKEALLKMKESPGLDSIPVILFSTSSSKIDQEFAATWGVELYTKPLNYTELEAIVAEFMKRCDFGE